MRIYVILLDFLPDHLRMRAYSKGLTMFVFHVLYFSTMMMIIKIMMMMTNYVYSPWVI